MKKTFSEKIFISTSFRLSDYTRQRVVTDSTGNSEVLNIPKRTFSIVTNKTSKEGKDAKGRKILFRRNVLKLHPKQGYVKMKQQYQNNKR